jgi:hypothetical protein
MRTVYVIHAQQDRAFVEDVVLRPLPILGFDHWVSSEDADAADGNVVLAVISEAAARSSAVRDGIARIAGTARALIPVRIDDTGPASVSPAIDALPWVAVRAPGGVPDLNQLRRDLGDLLPPPPDQRVSADVFVEAVPEDYRDRTGFDTTFLGDSLAVALPRWASPR